ncbi:hypothetical protein AJ79_10237 [Helicocarpus griseus UAMH5409]|uniref:Luciferase domain-containing protein n=1 Tax=Helicocarpus griseus UAMH5409 TaxID=1447875 RepID=A0A2B7WEX4_9EURO|nr:hypothetical protein AJ79_10237 [Helicocarpus griseus UAMH5409]
MQLPSVVLLWQDPISSSVSSLTLFTLVALCLATFARRVRKGYHAFLALGPGGTPSTPAGYLRICVLRIFTLRNPLTPPSIPSYIQPQSGILKDLPRRAGSRPEVVGIAPQRQMTDRGSKVIYSALTATIKDLSLRHPDSLFLGTSRFEKHSTGLFSLPRCQSHLTCNGEICHSHPCDGSMHLTLHPADVKTIIEKGWGERHPLARESWWWRFRFVPPTFVLIYSPRTMEEVRCVTRIIYAASWWISGIDLRKSDPNGVLPISQGQDEPKQSSSVRKDQVRSSCSTELNATQVSGPAASDMSRFPVEEHDMTQNAILRLNTA